jgi:hypothetical protein
MNARIRMTMAGFKQVAVDVQEMDAETTEKIAKKDIGRVLNAQEAQTLLKRLG